MADGTVPSEGSSAPGSGGKQVVVINKTATQYGRPTPPATSGSAANVPETPLSSGAPSNAPSQGMPVTGHGPTQKGADGHETVPARVPPPASAGTTGPKIASPSVNYDANQETPANVTHLGASGLDYQSEQAQQLQDKGGA